ncbi:MAG: hypothetical protein E7139_08770 [Rikenellaceae bacterium]|nr:hypothetical protein [Rikenellaceae bacterium]
MSRQCPKCGSYNTDPIVWKRIGSAVVEAGRVAAATIGGLFVAFTKRGPGKDVTRRIYNATKVEIRCYRCNVCGNEFE